MKRFSLVITLAGLLAFPATATAFHHRDLPSTDCAAAAAGSPSNDNGQAKESILEHNPFRLPLPPLGSPGNSGLQPVPGNGQGDGADHCANA